MDKSQYLKPRQYEMMAILLPDQPEEETQAMVEKMLGYITDQDGTIDSASTESPWGRRRLAYSIRHEGVDYRDGHYVLVYFTAMASALTEIERELKLDTNVIRYLLLQFDEDMGEKIDESAIAEGQEDAESDVTEAPEATEAETTEAPAETEATDTPETPKVTKAQNAEDPTKAEVEAATTDTEEEAEAPAETAEEDSEA